MTEVSLSADVPRWQYHSMVLDWVDLGQIVGICAAVAAAARWLMHRLDMQMQRIAETAETTATRFEENLRAHETREENKFGHLFSADRTAEERLEQVRTRVGAVEGDLGTLPTSRDMHALALQIERLTVRLDAAEKTAARLQDSIDRIDRYLQEMAR